MEQFSEFRNEFGNDFRNSENFRTFVLITGLFGASCAPITADLPWFVSSQYCLSPAESSVNSRSAVICFLSAGTFGNLLEACLSAMADNFLSNQVVLIDTKTF